MRAAAALVSRLAFGATQSDFAGKRQL